MNLVNRKLIGEILKYLDRREALVIEGARQVGKTSVLKILISRLEKDNPCFYFDLEEIDHLRLLNRGVDEFLAYLKALGAPSNKKVFVFIDEIHYLDNPTNFIKLLVDHHSHWIKLIISGSSSLALRRGLKESLVGRKLIFSLYPLDFTEFLIFKGEDKLAELLPAEPFTFTGDDQTRFFINEYKKYLNEFLVMGSYPSVALESLRERKIKLVKELVSGYVYKDVQILFSLERITDFDRIVKSLAIRMSNLLNVSELARDTGINRGQVKEYIEMLKVTFVLELILPYSPYHRHEVAKTPKVYFIDNGLRNAIINDFADIEMRQDRGELLENAVYSGLLKKSLPQDNIYFWRTQNQAEVDFILKRDNKIYPIEVSWSGKKTKALLSFMNKYHSPNGYVIHPDCFRREDNIVYIPLWWVI
ncbi:MAG: ATP-binding protein [candidate division WOR-3 bacterium]